MPEIKGDIHKSKLAETRHFQRPDTQRSGSYTNRYTDSLRKQREHELLRRIDRLQHETSPQA